MRNFTKLESIVDAARDAGMPVPDDVFDYDFDAFPHFNLFQGVQINKDGIEPGSDWHNAKVIMGLSVDEVKKVTWITLEKKGIKINRRK